MHFGISIHVSRYLAQVLRLVMLLAFVHFSEADAAPQIWFGPRFEATDLMDLFSPDAPWQKAAHTVVVFGAPSYKLLMPAVEPQLPSILADLRRHHIDLQVGLLPLSGAGREACGYGVEGYSAPGQSRSDVKRLLAYGADIRYFAMDEPLYYGHVFSGKNACRASIEQVAENVATTLKQVQSIYPGVAFGDVEPVGLREEHWLTDLERWFDAYQAATGQKLAFFRADVQWAGPWREELRQLTVLLRRKGIPLQVIFNGSGNVASDEDWVAQAELHFQEYAAAGMPTPQAAVFQSWTPRPTHLLPENDPGTLTHLIIRYAQWSKSFDQSK